MSKIYRLYKYIHYFLHFNLKLQFCAVLALTCALPAPAQRLSSRFLNYIDQYKEIAVKQAQEYGVPASITLAQGLLESGAGQSYLARAGNNHFGIKCHSRWKGESISVGDETSSTCYRQYRNAEESFVDHARFLQQPRYRNLYKLKLTDYKSWARGLQSCGYAENQSYATLLISLIEKYRLFQYDIDQPLVARRKKLAPDPSIGHDLDDEQQAQKDLLKRVEFLHHVHRKWNLHYIIAIKGDTYETIALEFNLKPEKLREFNDIDDESLVPATGDRVWVEPKAKATPEHFDYYTVRKGESLWSVSQEFGVRLKSLMKLNDIKRGQDVAAGDQIKLR
jgi:hypothetical protein